MLLPSEFSVFLNRSDQERVVRNSNVLRHLALIYQSIQHRWHGFPRINATLFTRITRIGMIVTAASQPPPGDIGI
jgi:hypothetical protein